MNRLLHDSAHFAAMANAVNPYGDGKAAARTVAAIEELLGVGYRTAEFERGVEDCRGGPRAATS